MVHKTMYGTEKSEYSKGKCGREKEENDFEGEYL